MQTKEQTKKSPAEPFFQKESAGQLSPHYLSPNYFAEMIFPRLPTVPKSLRKHQDRSDVLQKINTSQDLSERFKQMPVQLQESFLDFCMGNRGLKITYDPFFKHIFDHERYPGRLDMLISDILGQNVTVVSVKNPARDVPSADSSLIFMDIIVKLNNGSLINVEMQRIGLNFPIERAFCYGADMLMRQYDTLKEKLAGNFSYSKMNPVYVIVFMEESSEIFRSSPENYLHRSDLIFNTKLPLRNLLNFVFIPLDIFRKIKHNERGKEEHHTGFITNLSRLDAWLYFLSSDEPEDMERVIQEYPFFKDIYGDIMQFQYDVDELMYMIPEALQIMDSNTIKLMVEEQKEKLAAEREKILAEHQKYEAEKEKFKAEQQKVKAEQQKVKAEQQKVKAEQQKVKAEQQKVKAEQQKNEQLTRLNASLMAEIEALKAQLADRN